MSPAEPPRSAVWRWTAIALVTAAAFIGLSVGSVSHRPLPAPVPATAEATRFSAGRAAQHVAVIAREPHPTGSPAARAVARYIQDRVADTGIQPEVQQATFVEHGRIGQYRASAITNVLARLPGKDSHKAVLLAAHYDSVEGSRGAADDGAAVAAMLEVLRALKANAARAPLANDVIFLWTDAEENGLIGAKAFVRQHPWAADVAMVLNFDARGSEGPAILLESSDRFSAWTIEQTARAAPYLVGDSLARTLYERLPHSTDFNMFRALKTAGANFVLAEGWTSYHSALDTPEALDPRSLQHQGDLMFALASHFGTIRLDGLERDADVLFNPPALSAVAWPRRPLIAIVVIAAIVVIVCVGWAWRRGRVSLPALALGLLLPIVAGGIGVFAGRFVIDFLRARSPGMLAHHSEYTWGLALICVGLTAAVLIPARSPRIVAGLFAGQLFLLIALFVATLVMISSAPHVIGLPLLLAALACGVMLMVDAPRPRRLWLALCLSGAALVFMAPLVWMITLAAPGAEYLALAILPLLAGLCLPLRPLLSRAAVGVLAGLTIAAGTALILRLALMAPERSANAAAGEVTYVANVDAFPDWYLGDRRERGRRLTPATDAPSTMPVVDVVDDRPNGDRREVRLRIAGGDETAELSLRIASQSFVGLESVAGVAIDGDEHDTSREDCILHARGFADPFEITLRTGAAPLSIQVVDRRRTLTRAGSRVAPFFVQSFTR